MRRLNLKDYRCKKPQKKELVERVVDNIMDNLYDYRDLIRQLVQFAVNKWDKDELRDFIGDD
jgi:hypothetical protein